MKTKIETLTPVHIGSGYEFQGNYEYLYFKRQEVVVVIDDEKVLGILGEDNVGQWISCIENKEDLLELLQRRSRELQPEQVARRIIPVKGPGLGKDKPIKEYLFSGNGNPLVPGSSLKGAIRTVLWAHEVFQNQKIVQSESNLGITRYDRRSGREKFQYSDATLAGKFFGSDPNHDIFRLLMVGDAQFARTACFKTEVVNMGRDDWHIKHSITQFVEAVPAGETSEFSLHYNTEISNKGAALFSRNKELLKPESLFPLINRHTLRLVSSEISFWRDDEDNPEVLGSYLKDMEKIQGIISNCKPYECVLRLGWGTGFRSMTGDWHSILQESHYDRLVRILRPTHDEYLTYPKTMRLIAGGTPLGYIKLTLY